MAETENQAIAQKEAQNLPMPEPTVPRKPLLSYKALTFDICECVSLFCLPVLSFVFGGRASFTDYLFCIPVGGRGREIWPFISFGMIPDLFQPPKCLWLLVFVDWAIL